jgi:hypothetical protein
MIEEEIDHSEVMYPVCVFLDCLGLGFRIPLQ